jgi:LPS-assembly protein
MAADNLFAGYSFGRTTLGIGHALLNAVDDQVTNGVSPAPALSVIKSQQLQPFLEIGKPSGNGIQPGGERRLRLCAARSAVRRRAGGVQLELLRPDLGYRRFELGTVGSTSRDETQWLYSFTLANFGAVGDIRRANSVFRDPDAAAGVLKTVE